MRSGGGGTCGMDKFADNKTSSGTSGRILCGVNCNNWDGSGKVSEKTV